MNLATSILFYTYLASAAVLVIYYLVFFSKLLKRKDESPRKSEPISVVIAARNEGENLKENLPKILEQDYPNFEVVVINDSSFDITETVIYDLQLQYPHLKMTNIEESQKTFSGKKLPLTLGFKKAEHNNLLLTDADCYPLSNQWLKRMSSGYDKDFVIGYSPYRKSKGILNQLIRLDNTFSGQMYISMALSGQAYMGVGRNLGYKKDWFFQQGGFRSQYHIPSGDDDLLVNKFVKKDNYSVVLSEESMTETPTKKSLSEWYKQKRRHLSTSTHYKSKTKFLLGLYHSAQVLFYLCLILLMINKIALWWGLGAFATKTIIQLLISSKGFKKLKAGDLVALIPIYEPILLTLAGVVTLSLRFSKNIKWK